jgi:hypothetical protein
MPLICFLFSWKTKRAKNRFHQMTIRNRFKLAHSIQFFFLISVNKLLSVSNILFTKNTIFITLTLTFSPFWLQPRNGSTLIKEIHKKKRIDSTDNCVVRNYAITKVFELNFRLSTTLFDLLLSLSIEKNMTITMGTFRSHFQLYLCQFPVEMWAHYFCQNVHQFA